MGTWGFESDQNDHTLDATSMIEDRLHLNTGADNNYEPLSGQIAVDAKDAALLKLDDYHADAGVCMYFLKEGYRLSTSFLEASKSLLAEEKVELVAGDNNMGQPAERIVAIDNEIPLIDKAISNDGVLPENAQSGGTRGLAEEIFSRDHPAEYAEAKAADADPDSVVPAAPPLTVAFGWLSELPTKKLRLAAKAVGVKQSEMQGLEKVELVTLVRTHPRRWDCATHA